MEQELFAFARMTPAEYRDDCEQMRLTLEAPKKARPLSVGDLVAVDAHPLTREGFEGNAQIVRLKGKAREGKGLLYRAMVHFDDDTPGVAVERTVAASDVLP